MEGKLLNTIDNIYEKKHKDTFNVTYLIHAHYNRNKAKIFFHNLI